MVFKKCPNACQIWHRLVAHC